MSVLYGVAVSVSVDVWCSCFCVCSCFCSSVLCDVAVSVSVLCDVAFSVSVLCDVAVSVSVLYDVAVSVSVLCDVAVSVSVPCDVAVSVSVLCDVAVSVSVPCDVAVSVSVPCDVAVSVSVPCDVIVFFCLSSNSHCQWLLEAPSDDYLVRMDTVTMDLEAAPGCIYDSVTVYNGQCMVRLSTPRLSSFYLVLFSLFCFSFLSAPVSLSLLVALCNFIPQPTIRLVKLRFLSGTFN